MKKLINRPFLRGVMLFFFLMALFLAIPQTAREAQAATNGFRTVNGKTYYYKNGKKYTGWIRINGKKYYFYKNSGVMATGWVKNASGQKRYFYKSTGAMATGWMQNSAGQKFYFNTSSGILYTGWMKDASGTKRYFYKNTGVMATGWVKNSSGYRYFSPSSGYMYTGLHKVGKYYYYFRPSSGYRVQSGFYTISGSVYYFSPTTGRAKTGWLTLNGKKYYFSKTGVMYVNKIATISDKRYSFDEKGVAAEILYTYSGNSVIVTENGRNYSLKKEFATHPGIADGTVSDLDLLAALCECEAGDQGLIGMEAVGLTVLNRTLKPDKEWPSTLRYVIYQSGQYGPVSDGTLKLRLEGKFNNKELAYEAARSAFAKYNAYVNEGKKRVIQGFPKEDFDYWYFMSYNEFYSMNLDFDKVDYFFFDCGSVVQGHVFFVDWISPS